MDFVQRYLVENPQMRLLDSAEPEVKEMLIKAHEKKYISLYKIVDLQVAYSQDMVEQARMWKEKGCLDND